MLFSAWSSCLKAFIYFRVNQRLMQSVVEENNVFLIISNVSKYRMNIWFTSCRDEMALSEIFIFYRNPCISILQYNIFQSNTFSQSLDIRHKSPE